MLPGLVMDGPAGKRRGHAFFNTLRLTHPMRFQCFPASDNPPIRNCQGLMRLRRITTLISLSLERLCHNVIAKERSD
jgi:hypothetical protein